MNRISFIKTTAVLALLSCSAGVALADPPLAEERAHQVAVKFRDRGFYIQPIDAGILGRGEMIRIQIPVVRGLDYLILSSGDAAARDIDIYVYSEVESLILDDRRPNADALVQFRAQYTGSVYAYIFMAKTNSSLGLPSWAAFVGRRGNAAFSEKAPPAGAVNQGGGGNGTNVEARQENN